MLSGNGTYEDQGKIYSAAVGRLKIIGKLVQVEPFKERYRGRMGDVIIGRVAGIHNKS